MYANQLGPGVKLTYFITLILFTLAIPAPFYLTNMKKNHNMFRQLARNAKALRLRLLHAIRTNDREAFQYWFTRMGFESAWVFMWTMVPVSLCIAPFHPNGLPFAFAFTFLAAAFRTLNKGFAQCSR